MPNMELKKSPMPVQDAYARICNFDEVALGYTYETAVNEAKRCLNCKHKPCVSGCPVEIDIPAFLAKVAAEDNQPAGGVRPGVPPGEPVRGQMRTRDQG